MRPPTLDAVVELWPGATRLADAAGVSRVDATCPMPGCKNGLIVENGNGIVTLHTSVCPGCGSALEDMWESLVRRRPSATSEPGAGWHPQNLLELAGRPPEPPQIAGLFYPGRRHIVSGEYESGKSWLALCISAGELAADRGVIWVDADDMGAGAVLERLRALGVTDDQVGRLAYIQPSGWASDKERGILSEWIATFAARLLVVDAFNPAMSLLGLDPVKTPDVERFYRQILDPFRADGCAAVALDHLVKNPEASKRYSYGSERKASAADVHIGMTVARPFGRGKSGRARLAVHKDRPGFLSRPNAGVLTVDSTGTGTAWHIAEDSSTVDGEFRPTGLMEKVSRYLEAQEEARSRTQIETAVNGKAEYVRQAIDLLIAESYATEIAGARNARLVQLLRIYREDAE